MTDSTAIVLPISGSIQVYQARSSTKISYVSTILGSINDIATDDKLICYLYEHECILITNLDASYSMNNVSVVDRFYCSVFTKVITGIDYFGTPLYGNWFKTFLDTNTNKIFNINYFALNEIAAYTKRSVALTFATHGCVLNYVEEKKPEKLNITVLPEDEEIVEFIDSIPEVTIRLKKHSYPEQLC